MAGACAMRHTNPHRLPDKRREGLFNAEQQRAVDPTDASERAICIRGREATEYQEGS